MWAVTLGARHRPQRPLSIDSDSLCLILEDMQIHRLTAYQLPVRLRKPVRHASHERTANETIIVRCEMTDGQVGWGEGLPRTYVTGESTATAWRHLTATDFSPLAAIDHSRPIDAASAVDQLRLAQVDPDDDVKQPRECFGNAVRCALEIAVVDAACRSAGCSVGDLIRSLPDAGPLLQPVDQVYYSGAVTSMSPRKQWLSALKMRVFAFRTVKVKIGADGIDDAACMRRVRRVVGSRADLRVDANEAWHCEQVTSRMLPLLKYSPTCLEQPVPHTEVAGLADVRTTLPVPVMLDESLCCIEDGRRAIDGRYCDLFNIRLSKCGGILRSVALARQAFDHKLGYQLGCQVGETAILSAAGRHFACNIGGIRYLEGSFDRFLIHDAFSEQDLTFRYGGRGDRLNGPGLGMTVCEHRLIRTATHSQELLR